MKTKIDNKAISGRGLMIATIAMLTLSLSAAYLPDLGFNPDDANVLHGILAGGSLVMVGFAMGSMGTTITIKAWSKKALQASKNDAVKKALQKDEAAVSPVVGVILMVAIAVVLATVVFVLVNNLSGQPESTPRIDFQKDTDSLMVVQADAADWTDVEVNGCTAPEEGPVTAGDVLTDCTGSVTVVYVPSNALIYSAKFA